MGMMVIGTYSLIKLEKFKGKDTMATFNFNGDPQAATAAILSASFLRREFVGKNVCHDVRYDMTLHRKVLVCLWPYLAFTLFSAPTIEPLFVTYLTTPLH